MFNILLTDDEASERDGIKFLIEKYQLPLKVHEAANGKVAYDYIREHEIDILFTDVKMPYMDGLELAKKAKEWREDIVVIVFSAYSEFEYAKKACDVNAVNYLLKPIELDEFNNVMTKAIDICTQKKKLISQKNLYEKADKSRLLYQMLNSQEATGDILERLRPYGVELENKYMQLVTIETGDNFFESMEQKFEEDLNKVMETRFEYINIYPNLSYLLIYHSSTFSDERMERMVKKIYRSITAAGEKQVSLLVGKRFYGANHLKENIDQMKQWMEDTFHALEGIVFISRFDGTSDDNLQKILAIKESIFANIEKNNLRIVREQINLYIDSLLKEKAVSSIYLKYIFVDIIKAMFHQCGFYNPNQIIKTTDDIMKSVTLKDMQEVIGGVIDKLEELSGTSGKEDSHIVAEVKKIIMNEYMNELSLDELADRVGLAPAYLSFVYKKETGNNLVKYLTEFRMSRAKELLEQGKMKIVDIGKACGYQNQSYFNRLFKNIYGVTPKQYRENGNA